MRTITCKKCGSVIDADLGECPVCGMIYYVLPDQEKAKPTPTPTPAGDDRQPTVTSAAPPEPQDDEDFTKVWKNPLVAPPEQDEGDFTKVWKNPLTDQKPAASSQETTRIDTSAAQSAAAAAARRSASRSPASAPASRGQTPQPARTNTAQTGTDGAAAARPKSRGGWIDRRAKLFVVITLALLAVLTVILCAMAGVFNFNSKDYGTMPSVVGLTVTSAETVLENYDITVDTKYEYSDTTEGIVIRQSIEAYTALKKNASVTLTISRGPDPNAVTAGNVVVPNIVGKSYTEARSILNEYGLKILISQEVYSDKPENEVLSQTPLDGAQAAEGEYVRVTVSLGEEPPKEHTITVTSGKGGSVTPNGQVTVKAGNSMTFSIIPDSMYDIDDVLVDGISVGPVYSYTFEDIDSNHTIYAIFKLAENIEPSDDPGTSDDSGTSDNSSNQEGEPTGG